ncbi:MAG TPA: DNA polymerase III subunit delta [Steroidobacteraceae bacterium]|nr:DNA polymerase III subunit delta [Steroidobacteraceae bacterium]
MRTSPDGLPKVLARGLPSACLVTGSEPLLIEESCDLIRHAAREQGFAEREVHFLERGFDWDALLSDANNLSLFATRRLIELKLKGGPDVGGAKHLAELAMRPPPDTLLLVAGELEPRSQKAAWVGEFERHGWLVVGQPVERERLPAWISARLEARGVALEAEAAELLAERVEGNLLAAQQEIERIALLKPGARLDAAATAEIVSDNARYDVFELAAAAMAGQAPRALRILAGLRGEGLEPPLVLWALVNDLRALSRVVQLAARSRSLEDAFRAAQVWSSRQAPLRVALRRLSAPQIEALLLAAARADRVAKGSLRGDAWVEIEGLVARMAGVALAA